MNSCHCSNHQSTLLTTACRLLWRISCRQRVLAILAVPIMLVGLRAESPPPPDTDPRAANARVKNILETFPGRGVLADDTQPTPPTDTLKNFEMLDGFEIDLVLSEPEIEQPLFVSWDSRGRLWVIQYRQYQYPAGLKVVRFDQHLRAVFDRVPEPPPTGPRGADRITVHEDSDGDGKFDTHREVITGLNIATAVQTDAHGIWVLNPPYLLYYHDRDQDDQPEGPPDVHLSGFGLQDTHSVANSLRWGPDGWLYGANGSTTGGTVSSQNTKGVTFQGQCIWRYHPKRREFEIYAEGGGNTFSCEIDAGGRLFSGTNGGNTRGLHYPQGAYFRKNWGKHGPLTNPYAFGFLEPMPSSGDPRRFPQAMTIYDGGLYPDEFSGRLFAANAMTNTVLHSERVRIGSTFKTVDHDRLVTTSDHWFRPVYAGVGPDGCVYLADWYDSRLSHVSPTDDWHKSSGRVYRIRPKDQQPTYQVENLNRLPIDQLVTRLQHGNKWVRHRATLELGWRADTSVSERLVEMVDSSLSLEALWALNLLDQLTTDLKLKWLHHPNANIRRWIVRLWGDDRSGHEALARLATSEHDAEVRSQLASTAKRISSRLALPIIEALITHHEDMTDPHLPLLIWWALEAHVEDWPRVSQLFATSAFQESPIAQQFLVERLSRRYAASGEFEQLEHVVDLIELARRDDNQALEHRLLRGVEEALAGREPPRMPMRLSRALERYRESIGQHPLVASIRRRDPQAIKQGIAQLNDSTTPLAQRIELAESLAQSAEPIALEQLLGIATRSSSTPALQRVAIRGLSHFQAAEIGERLTRAFDNSVSAEHGLRDTACRTLASRPAWAKVLLREINAWRIRPEQIPPDVVQQLRAIDDAEVQSAANEAFGPLVAVAAPEKIAEIEQLTSVLVHSSGDAERGEKLFQKHCATCHRLFGAGSDVGPPLDNYDRGNLKFWLPAIVDPSLEIREGYQTYAATTDDGRVITGTIANQNPDTVALRTAEGQQIVTARERLESLRALERSLMPEGLLKLLTEQQIRDLFQYLRLGIQP